ncbi:unnamed protein product [Knipowitschia caucasica]
MSSLGLSLVLALVLASTAVFVGAQTTCRGRCGEGYSRANSCQCDYGCLVYGECCKDYERLCTSEGTCKGRCGENFKRGRSCSCDSECVLYNQCCPDHVDHCNQTITTPSASEEPATTALTTQPATTPAATTPAATTPAATTPAATTPAATTPAATTPAATTPAATTPAASEEPATTPAATTPAASEEPATTPAASEEPATTPAASEEPATTPAASEEPATTPAATTPAASEEPATTPAASEEPATTPAASEEPATTPAASEEPATTPAASEEPATTPAASEEPATTPAASEEPATTPAASEEPATTPAASEEPATTPAASEEPATTLPTTQPASTAPPIPDLDGFEVLPESQTTAETDPTAAPPPTVTELPPDPTTPAPTAAPSSPASETPPTTTPVPQTSTPVPETTTPPPSTKEEATTAPAADVTTEASVSKPAEKPFEPAVDLDNKPVLNGLEDPADYPADDSNDRDLCSGRPITGVTTLSNGTVVVFRGHYFWVLDENKIPGQAQEISEVWGTPSPIDTVFTRCNCQGKTYIFKGPQYWRYENDVMDPGFPKVVETGFDGLRGPVTAALSVPQHKQRREAVYFFQKGGKVQKYSYQFAPSSCGRKVQYAVYTRRQRTVRQVPVHVSLLEPAINYKTAWRGFPATVTAAVSIPNRREADGFSYHIFNRAKSYRIRIEAERPVVVAVSANTSQTNEVFRCPRRNHKPQ